MGGERFCACRRREVLEWAADNVVDVIVVGGGITGAGIAREAALRGLSVVLLDRGDFASGTSSRSSKLIHGGVRYLQQGDIGLVREAARERAVLRRIAPHLARPTSMLVPARSRRGRLKLSAGLWTFDRLAGEASDGGHRILDRQSTRSAEPGLRTDRLAGAVSFTEYVTSDSRLTLETILAAVACGALAANYAVVRAIEESSKNLLVAVRDEIGREDFVVRTRVVVNAAGPWFDEVRGFLGGGGNGERLVQLTRGIHIVFPLTRLPVRHTVVLAAPDGRSTFVVPVGDACYVGTTDTLYEGDPSEPGVTKADADYLLESLAATFVDAPTAGDIIGTWAGVRPLLVQEGKSPSEISRRDEIRVGPGPVVAIAGGKLTTYRKMAERVITNVFELLGRKPPIVPVSDGVALAGGNEAAQKQARAAAPRLSDRELDDRLWATYGQRAAGLVRAIAADPRLAQPVGGLDALTQAELDFFVKHEMAMSPDDVLRRRCHVAMFDTEAALMAAKEVADCMVAHACIGHSFGRALEEWIDERRGELETVRGRGVPAEAAHRPQQG